MSIAPRKSELIYYRRCAFAAGSGGLQHIGDRLARGLDGLGGGLDYCILSGEFRADRRFDVRKHCVGIVRGGGFVCYRSWLFFSLLRQPPAEPGGERLGVKDRSVADFVLDFSFRLLCIVNLGLVRLIFSESLCCSCHIFLVEPISNDTFNSLTHELSCCLKWFKDIFHSIVNSFKRSLTFQDYCCKSFPDRVDTTFINTSIK